MYAAWQDNYLTVSNLGSFYNSIVKANHPLFLQMSSDLCEAFGAITN